MRAVDTIGALLALLAWGVGLFFGVQASMVALRIGPLPCCDQSLVPNTASAAFFFGVPMAGLAASLLLLWRARRAREHGLVFAASLVWLLPAAGFTLVALLSGPVPL